MALVQHWKLDDNAANTTVTATVGSNGTLEGGDNTSVKQSAGPGGTVTWAFDLNGSDDAVDISGAGINFANLTAWSLSLWFRPDHVTNNYLLGRSASAFRFVSVLSSTAIRVETSSAAFDFTVPAIGTGAWHHLYITRTAGNSMRLWLDGTESSTGAQAAGGILTLDRIGKRSTNFYDGRVSQVRVWDSDETADAATWYAEGVSGGSALPVLMHSHREQGICA